MFKPIDEEYINKHYQLSKINIWKIIKTSTTNITTNSM